MTKITCYDVDLVQIWWTEYEHEEDAWLPIGIEYDSSTRMANITLTMLANTELNLILADDKPTFNKVQYLSSEVQGMFSLMYALAKDHEESTYTEIDWKQIWSIKIDNMPASIKDFCFLEQLFDSSSGVIGTYFKIEPGILGLLISLNQMR